MKEFFEGMSGLEQIYWIVAIIGSVIFGVIFLITIFGGMDIDADVDVDMDVDAGTDFNDFDSGGFHLFTFKNVMAFFTVFGWTGLSCLQNHCSTALTIIVSVFAGIVMMVLIASLFYWIMKMAQSGTMDIKNAIGNTGEVYIPIGAKRSKTGKIHIEVQGTFRELDAITDDKHELPTGQIIKVISIISQDLLLVTKL